MNTKTLKIGLVMAGGTSMGVFTGVALTESLKQILIFAKNKQGDLFEKIEIDIMTGASAGSVVLALLFRSLINADDICPLTQKEIQIKLIAQYGSPLWESLSEDKKNDLIRLQQAQEIQIEVWTKELEIKNFLKDSGELNKSASVLNSSILSEIAQKYMFPPKTLNKKLLANRVLMQFTLSRLAAFRHDGRSKFTNEDKNTPLAKALGDGLVTYDHRDSRTFDIHLNGDDKNIINPTWIKVKPHNKAQKNSVPDSKFWAQSVSTAIASAAFPFALEPVVLMRNKSEYGAEWPDELSDFEEYPFTYIDGGVLNNEPIREAFKLAQIIDSKEVSFERKIIFIDPNVKEKQGGFNPGIHGQFYFPKHKSKFQELELKNTHQRLGSFIWPMINMYEHQSKVIEGDKILDMKKRFAQRREFHKNLIAILPDKVEKERILYMVKVCENLISTNKSSSPLDLSIWKALEKVIKTYNFDFFSNIRGYKSFETFFLQLKTKLEIENSRQWYAALWLLYGDFTLGLQKKDENSELVPIAPYDFKTDNIVRLPGAEVAGFAGFSSKEIADFTIRFARNMSSRFLKLSHTIPEESATACSEIPILTFEEVRKDKDFQKNMKIFYDRIEEVLTAKKLSYEVIWKFGELKNKISSFLEKTSNTKTYEFRIEIPKTLAKKLELDGKDFFDTDMKTVTVNKTNYLVTFADYDSKSGKWAGIHLNKAGYLSIDYDGDKHAFCQIEMPSLKHIQELELMPNPFFRMLINYGDKKQAIKNNRWDTNHFGVTALDRKLEQLFTNKYS